MELELDFTRQWDNDQGKHTTTLVIGRVKMIYIREDVLADDGASIVGLSLNLFEPRYYTHFLVLLPDEQDPAAMKPVSRIAGTMYTRTTQ